MPEDQDVDRMQEVVTENIGEEIEDVQPEQVEVESIGEVSREPSLMEEMEEVNGEGDMIPEVDVSMMTSSSGHSEEKPEQQETYSVPNSINPIIALPSPEAMKAMVKSSRKDSSSTNIARTQDLLAKYSNEGDLLNAIELIKENFTNDEVVVPQLITNNMTEENVQQQLQDITIAIGKSEEKIFYGSVQKALLFLTYFLQWKYLDDDLFLKLKGRVNGKRYFFLL